MGKRILVTGSAGFIGAHFVEHLIAKTDWHIIGLDSFRHRGDSQRVYQDPKRYEVFTHDLTTPISTRLRYKVSDVDYIVNVASESHVDRSITDPVPFVQNNVNLALNMLELARELKPKAFVQVSTDEVCGPALDGVNHAEWSTPLPSNPYAASKAAQEAIAQGYWRTYGVPVIITRTMNNFGERQDTEKFIPMLIKRIQRGETCVIHGSPGNIGSRKYLHARNHADAILFILKNIAPIQYNEGVDRPDMFNVVGDVEKNNLEMAELVADMLRKALKYDLVEFHKARPGHDRRYSLDGSKLKSFGWVPPVDFETSLRKTIEWSLNHPEWLT